MFTFHLAQEIKCWCIWNRCNACRCNVMSIFRKMIIIFNHLCETAILMILSSKNKSIQNNPNPSGVVHCMCTWRVLHLNYGTLLPLQCINMCVLYLSPDRLQNCTCLTACRDWCFSPGQRAHFGRQTVLSQKRFIASLHWWEGGRAYINICL